MSKKLWDVIVVGGGPAGIAAALRLARKDLDVVVVEAATYPGAENWSGAVYFAESLAPPEVLGADGLEEAPYERRVVKRGFFSCNGPTLVGAEYRNPEAFRHCYTVLRPVYDRYLAERARGLGVVLLNETTVDGLIRRGERVVGVHTDRGPLYGELVFLAEGDASQLVSKEGFERPGVRAKPTGQPAFLQGVKEVIELDPGQIEDRFGVGSGEAACYEVLLRNGVIDGKPIRLNMAGFIYTNRSSVSIGLVLPLENLTRLSGSYNTLMEWYKSLPPIQRLIAGGESTSYGAKVIRGGGLKELPQLVDDGVAIGGAATGIGVDFPYPNFTGPACAMGRIFADAALQLRAEGGAPTRERLEELYVDRVQETNYYQDVEHLRDWPAFIEHSEALFGRGIDLLNGSTYVMTRPDLPFGRKWWETVRLVGETLKGEWRRTLGDLRLGSKALGTGWFALKHTPLALLLSIPNTVLALFPFLWGKGSGELQFHFWVKDQETGRLPWFKRWLGARYRPALSRAAAVLYANDNVPIRRKLDRCVALALSRLSLWELLGLVVGVLGYGITRGLQRLNDLIRSSLKRPTLRELQQTFYARWLALWRSHSDLASVAASAAKSHDAKLSEISYEDEAGAHIKVFFPPDAPDRLEDPSRSSLWSVCPAAVYQLNIDRTAHASVAVNFENCVKCETCWRIEPQHVDWTRFGKHRLIYEVYTEADEALQRALAQRSAAEAPMIEPDIWPATLAEVRPDGEPEPASEELDAALSAALRAIAIADACCKRLRDDIWHGPRVLEPGQVEWYQRTIEYVADLADEAGAAALAPPIEGWLAEHEASALHLELLQLRSDLEAVAARIREHGGARRFFAAEADARQILQHHLTGLRACLTGIAEACLATEPAADPVSELRSVEVATPERGAARSALREHLARVFDRGVVRRLEHGGALEPGEVDVLRDAARAAAGVSEGRGGGFEAWDRLQREDVMAELARVDASLAALVASHLAGVEALQRAGAPGTVLEPLVTAEAFAALAMEAEATPADAGWNGEQPFVLAALADRFVVCGHGRVALFERDDSRAELTGTPAIGLLGAQVSTLSLSGAEPVWQGEWSDRSAGGLFGSRSRDVAAMALGAGSLATERAVEHARSRIQFPDMFQDLDGRDGVGKFGAVRAHISHMETARLAIETLLMDAPWSDPEGLGAPIAKVAVTDLFGPDMPSITYRAGQVIGGTAFSEDDVFSKLYRDSSIFPHYIRENAQLNVEIGARLAAHAEAGVLRVMERDLDAALEAVAERAVLGFEVQRLRAAEDELTRAMHTALQAGEGAPARQVVNDVVGELATRLYVWARLIVRAHRRLEAALAAERHVEAAQLWADTVEERLVMLEDELIQAASRVELGGYAFELEGYPDKPIATTGLGFDYYRDVVQAERGYRSGDFLLKPLQLAETRYVPELVWADERVRSHYEEYLALFRERFIEPDYEPSYGRHIESLHYIPREDIDWTRDQGFFRVVIPTEYGGQGRTKADYYNLCQVSKRLADVSHALTIQANTSIGTTPMLFGLFQDVAGAERALKGALAEAESVAGIEAGLQALVAKGPDADPAELESDFIALNKEASSKLARGHILKKVIFGRFLSQMRKAGAAGMKGDLDGFFDGLRKAQAALDGWRERVEAELDEMPRRRLAHEFYLRLISARMISAFALTEPSAGSDTARIRTEARPDWRRVHTDEDGVKYFYLDEENREGRRNIADLRRFEFDYDRSKTAYRWSDDAEPAEVISQEYTYEEGEEKYRYFMIGDRRVDIHDMALIRERDGQEVYEFFVLNGAKMWITNGHIAGVEALYARTPAGVTGFMVDALTDGFLVGKDEEKTGQRGSPTNEITLTNVRVPRECMIGIEGRGQENALETLNVGRTGLCISSTAWIQQGIADAREFLSRIPRGSEGWVRYRLGLALEEMFAVESLAYDLIGLYDDKTSDALRMESSVGKLVGTDGLHRMLHFLEPVYGIEGQTQLHNIEKDRRDARVMTIYEGTNEIQQFLLLKDMTDMIGPKLEDLEAFQLEEDDSAYAQEVEVLGDMLRGVRERLLQARKLFGRATWQRALLQPIFFRLSLMTALVKTVESVVHRAHWIDGNLTAEGDRVRRGWSELAARGLVSRAQREFSRIRLGFDRDLETLRAGGRTAELKLAETVLDEFDAVGTEGGERVAAIPRAPIARDLEIVVAMEQAPKLAPRPRVRDGRLSEHVYAFTAGDRRALRLALALKAAAPERVRVTLATVGRLVAEDALRFGLAAGADAAILLDTDGDVYAEHAVASAIVGAIREREMDFDLLLSGSTTESMSEGRLPLRLAEESQLRCVPGVRDLWVDGDAGVFSSERFPEAVRLEIPVVVAVSANEDEPEWDFSTTGFIDALHKPLSIVAFPADAERSDEELAATSAPAAAEGEETGSVEPDRAAEVLVQVGDLGDGAGTISAAPYTGKIDRKAPEELSWEGVVFVAELDGVELARSARAPLEAAEGIADQSSLSLTGLVLSGPLSEDDRRAVAGQLLAAAAFHHIVFAEHESLTSEAPRAYAEALVRLMGPEAASRPAYLVSSPWLSEALPSLATALRGAQVPAEELAGVNRVEFGDGDGIEFVRPTHERRLRARRKRSARGNGMRILWCEPEVSAEGGGPAAGGVDVVRTALQIDYDPQTDALARALAEARKELGLVTLENAEFIIDVGAGLGSVDNLETVVEPLRQALVELGAPHVVIGATRKVTMDLSWLPDEHQIGQTGVRVNPRVMIALGVSGAPQHIDYVGDRAVIFAFNMDAQAPLMTLNQRREQPKVYPVVGDLFKTVPKFIAALKSRRAGPA